MLEMRRIWPRCVRIHSSSCTANLGPQAFQELAKGERTAAALENQLSQMEERIEALLAQAEREQQEVQDAKSGKGTSETSSQTQQSDKGNGEGK